jgi:hypothetical protein
MSNYASIAATGKSIERHLAACFRTEAPVLNAVTTAVLVGSEDFAVAGGNTNIAVPALSIYLYRIEPNRVMRAAWSGVGSENGRAHLPIDLHYLLTAWGDNPEHEHQIMGKTLECLESRPILTGPMLYPTAGWEPGDAIHIVTEDLETEALLRMFDSLHAEFRLSMSYVARVARIDGTRAVPPPRVTTAVAGAQP